MLEQPPSPMENTRPSGLKQPSRLPALAGGLSRPLQETAQSELNTRAAAQHTTMLPPAINANSKHKISGLPEPPTKRKTLAERAGEPANPFRTHQTKPSSSSIAGFGSRQASNASTFRSNSNASTASALNGVRPASRQANGTRPLGGPRPPSSTEIHGNRSAHESDLDESMMARRKGTSISSFNSALNAITFRKTRSRNGLDQQGPHPQPERVRLQHSDSYNSGCDSSEVDDSHSGHSRGPSSSSTSSSVALNTKQVLGGPDGASKPSRNVSLSTAFAGLSIDVKSRNTSSKKHRPSLERIKEEASPSKIPKFSCTPSLCHIPSLLPVFTASPVTHKPTVCAPRTPATSPRRRDELPVFLTKEKLTAVAAWDTNGRLDDMESMYSQLQRDIQAATSSNTTLEESVSFYKTRVQELTSENRELSSNARGLSSDLERARNELHTTATDFRQVRRDHERELNELERRHEKELANLHLQNEKDVQKLERDRERESLRLEKEMGETRIAWEKKKDEETADLTSQHWDEMEELRAEQNRTLSKLNKELDALKQAGESRATESAGEVQNLRDAVSNLQGQLDASNATTISLRSRITTFEGKITLLEQEKHSLVSKAHFLEGNQEAQSHEFTSLSEKLQDAIAVRDATLDTLRKEEMLRRKLNATILELRGNIRVYARTRPLLNDEECPAKVDYVEEDSLDGCKEMVVHAPTTQSATGKQRNEKHNYAFDRVFAPGTENAAVFDECRDLIQSVVDGYNVSILSYGQTGSGKTYGMSGPAGIIPSSIRLLLSEMQRLQEKGWEYAVEASFVEVYNETLNDLLGDAKSWDEVDDMGGSIRGKKKERHEIHHDATTGKTTVTNLTSISLWPSSDGSVDSAADNKESDSDSVSAAAQYTENAVTNLLDTAAKNRRVAATKANERSSRSHSIFILTLKGFCAATNESSEGILNLVDLAGSERLKQSGAEGSRMKETQAINKSLSSLGDVIAALGNRGASNDAHVPYRNSKLTYLLQSSLGGTTAGKSSRTLMLLHLSPLQTHWQESRSSLLFGSKVHGTHIGTAKKR